MRHAQLIANSTDDEIDQVLNRGRAMIEPRHRGQNDRSDIGESFHVFKLNAPQRCFARDQNQLASFFQMHVRRTMNKV